MQIFKFAVVVVVSMRLTVGPNSFAIRRTLGQSKGQHQVLKTTRVKYCCRCHRLHLKFTTTDVWQVIPGHSQQLQLEQQLLLLLLQ